MIKGDNKMKVTLLNYADPLTHYINNRCIFNHEHLAGIASAICVDKFEHGTDDYSNNMKQAVNSGHYSVLEHLPLTFLIKDISRACSHQLVRHRLASYSQQSQRYAKINTNEEWYIEPESIVTYSKNITDKYRDLMENIAEFYQEMISKGIPKEDARMVLPNACFTSIVVSINARSFVEQCQKRLCKRSQWEIQELYIKMKESIKLVYPTVYRLCVPPCVSDKCKEVKSCKS